MGRGVSRVFGAGLAVVLASTISAASAAAATPKHSDARTRMAVLNVRIVGLSGSAHPSVTLTGSHVRLRLIKRATVARLAPGRYQITAARLDAKSVTYAPTPRSRTIKLAAGERAHAVVRYRRVATTVKPSPPPPVPAGPPGAPVNLHVVQLAVAAATVAWDAPTTGASANHYELFIGDTSVGTTNATRQLVTGLQAACINGASLTVGVEAVDAQSRHSNRSTISIMPLCGGGGGGSGGGGSSGGGGGTTGGGSTTSGDQAPQLRSPAPAGFICSLSSVIDGPPKAIVVTIQDGMNGIKAVATETTNGTAVVSSFTAGSTSPIQITATKTDQTRGSTLALTITDGNGQQILCS